MALPTLKLCTPLISSHLASYAKSSEYKNVSESIFINKSGTKEIQQSGIYGSPNTNNTFYRLLIVLERTWSWSWVSNTIAARVHEGYSEHGYLVVERRRGTGEEQTP